MYSLRQKLLSLVKLTKSAEVNMEKFVISGERKISHQDILQNAAKAARGLEEECGISVADSVAIFMRNDFAFFEMSLAAAALGAYSVPVNWHYTADEANYVLTNCGAKALIIHADLLPNIADGFLKVAGLCCRNPSRTPGVLSSFS